MNPEELTERAPSLPELREGLLTPDNVRLLARELLEHAEVQGTLLKAGPRQQTAAEDTSLEVAVERLLSGSVPAIQIRYAFAGREWTDTLFRSPAGIRIVRCQH